MRLATVEQATRIDEAAQNKFGIDGETLMENAGRESARRIERDFVARVHEGPVAIVCGPGNNGGDALVCARELRNLGYTNLVVFLAAPREARSNLFHRQFDRAEKLNLRFVDLFENPESLDELKSARLIVDGLFGIGLRRKIEGEFAKIVSAVNEAGAPIVALDVPSGLNADNGRVEGIAVRATRTLTFGLAKPGFYSGESPNYLGQLKILDIGFPPEAVREIATSHFLFSAKMAARQLPKRAFDAHKSDFGRVLVVAGQPGMWGAGILSSSAAFRAGSGYVHWASHTEPLEILKQVPEVMTASVMNKDLWKHHFDAVAIGPGLGCGANTAKLIEKLKKVEDVPVVVDADAITVCVEHNLFPLPRNWIMTPHAGELSRVLKVSSEEINQDRYWAAFEAAALAKCHVLLKGYRTLVCDGRHVWVINAGNAALAKAGTGDVLTGIVAGLLSQGLKSASAAATAAFLHGKMADDWLAAGKDQSSLIASDLNENMSRAIGRLRQLAD